MPDRLHRSFAHRSLLTDTLPYEVPVIFSNDRYHACLSVTASTGLEPILKKITGLTSTYTIPYNYEVSVDQNRSRTLSIVHPISQKAISEFYELHSGGILSHSSRGQFSLRRPVALASPYAREIAADAERSKSGIPQLLANGGEADMSHMSSYFAYGKYNLLGKFISSREFRRLETRYNALRQMDVSKCFYNIYTHSITWAVKSKKFAKEQKDTYSFESAFDKLMQRCNYNETNGIVVGPEFSRIFAEIILQDIDDAVDAELRRFGIRAGLEYDVRRYVDDYFIFAGSVDILDKVEASVRKHLERYKLYVNDKKVTTQIRPFVSNLTLARDEVSSNLREISNVLVDVPTDADPGSFSRKIGTLRARFNAVRLTVARYDVQYANLSGWLLSRLKRIIRRAAKSVTDGTDDTGRAFYGEVAILCLETALYICAIDIRVRTTYTICQISLIFNQSRGVFKPEQDDLASHLISDYLGGMVRYRMVNQGDQFAQKDDVELCNLLICGAYFVGEDFLTSAVAREALQRMVSQAHVTYFRYITLAFCFRRSLVQFGGDLATLHSMARDRVIASNVDIARDTEEYLIAVDYLSSPDVSAADKQSLFGIIFGKNNPPSHSLLNSFGQHLGFTDWAGVTVEHQLRRKELRPVYAWS